MIEKIEIPLSKRRITLLLIGCSVFVFLGLLCILIPETFVSFFVRNPLKIQIIGIASVIFFGICSVFISKKIIDKRPGLIIDQDGITDNSNATSVGLIDWEDIKGIQTLQFGSSRIIMLLTDQPEKYVNRAKNLISRNAMQLNSKLYGSPLSIISNSLKIEFYDLEKLIQGEFEKRRK